MSFNTQGSSIASEVIIEPDWRKWESPPRMDGQAPIQSKTFFKEYEKYRLRLEDQKETIVVERVSQSAFFHWISVLWEGLGGKPLGERVTNHMTIKLPLDQRVTLALLNENKKLKLREILYQKALDGDALIEELKPPPALAEIAEFRNVYQTGPDKFPEVNAAVVKHFAKAKSEPAVKQSFMERIAQIISDKWGNHKDQ